MFDLGLKGAKCFVSGGRGGLGQAIVQGLMGQGAEVVLTSRTLDKAKEVSDKLNASGLPGKSYPVAMDANDLNSIRDATILAHQALNEINCLVHCAGGNIPGEFVEPGNSPFAVHPDEVRKAIDSNLMSIVNVNFILGPILLRSSWCSILNIGSMAAFRGLPGILGYSLGKAGVHAMTPYLASMLGLQQGAEAIRVNTIAFGFTETDQNRDKLRNPDSTLKPRAGAIASMHPGGEFGKTEDIVGPALFLLSPTMSAAVTGQVLSVDRGFTSMSLPRYGNLA